MDRDTAITILGQTPTNSKEFESGEDARFLRINDRWGLKLFHTEEERNKSHTLQSLAASHDLAPDTGDTFQFTDPDNVTYYGFVTGCIKATYADHFANMIFGCPFNDLTDEQQDDIDNQYYDDPRYDALDAALNQIMEADDMHYCNVGFDHKGKLVAIDFSRSYPLDKGRRP